VLVPDRSRGRTDLYRTAHTTSLGRFTIGGIAPGDYKIFAWEAIKNYAWFDPEVLKDGDAHSSAAHISDGAQSSVAVKVIPAEAAP
jgi:hypothetical protein